MEDHLPIKLLEERLKISSLQGVESFVQSN